MARRSTSMAASPSSWSGMHTRTSAPSLSTARENGSPWVWSQCRWPSSSAPRNGRSPSRAPRPRSPVPASSTQAGRGVVARQRDARRVAAVAREGVPGCRGGPAHTEHVDLHERGLLLSTVALADLGQLVEVELHLAGFGDLAGAHGDQCGRALPALEDGPLADERARAEVGDLLAVDVHLDDAVEQQVDGVGLLALGGERGALLQLADLGLALAHDHPRQLPLHRRLDLGDERRRVLAAPRAVVAEGVAVPVLEVDEART